MKIARRRFLQMATGAIASPSAVHTAWAQTYPSRPITLIVPFGAGGPTDVYARIVAEHMSRTLGQRLVIENVAGAGGTTASTRAMRANPDGYTIQIGHIGTHATASAFYPNLAYRPDLDFEPIGRVSIGSYLIAATKSFPAHDLNEFVAHAKANHGKLNMGHAGVGSASHLMGLLLNSILALKPATVPFNSQAAAMNAMVAGHIDYMIASTSEVVPQLQAGTIKVFAIASPERNPALPQIPTTREAGLPQFQTHTWNGLFAPKQTPKPIIDKLAHAIDQALDDETTRKRMRDLGADVPAKEQRGPAALAELVKSEIARWVPIIRAANVTVKD